MIIVFLSCCKYHVHYQEVWSLFQYLSKRHAFQTTVRINKLAKTTAGLNIQTGKVKL